MTTLKLSTGQDSTLGNYRDLCAALFGEGAKSTQFFDERIAKQGRDEEVIQAESQMLMLIATMETRHD